MPARQAEVFRKVRSCETSFYKFRDKWTTSDGNNKSFPGCPTSIRHAVGSSVYQGRGVKGSIIFVMVVAVLSKNDRKEIWFKEYTQGSEWWLRSDAPVKVMNPILPVH